MAIMKPLCLLFIVTSVKYVSPVDPAVCYVCEGFGSHSACRNRLDSSMIRVCPDPESSCGYVKLDHFWFFYTKRACGRKFDEEDDILKDYTRRTGKHVSPTMCYTHLCNRNVDLPTRMVVFICAMVVSSSVSICLFMIMKRKCCRCN